MAIFNMRHLVSIVSLGGAEIKISCAKNFKNVMNG